MFIAILLIGVYKCDSVYGESRTFNIDVLPQEIIDVGTKRGDYVIIDSLDTMKRGIGNWLKRRCMEFYMENSGKGVLPSVLFCQMGNETGWGMDGSTIVMTHNNLFCLTGKGDKGVYVRNNNEFSSFSNWDACLDAFFTRLDNSTAFWTQGLMDLQTWQEQMACIMSANYCTDPVPYSGIYIANAVTKIISNSAYKLDSEISQKYFSILPSNDKLYALDQFKKWVTRKDRANYYSAHIKDAYADYNTGNPSLSQYWLKNPRCGKSPCTCGFCWVASRENIFEYVYNNKIEVKLDVFDGSFVTSTDSSRGNEVVSEESLGIDYKALKESLIEQHTLSGYFAESSDKSNLSTEEQEKIIKIEDDMHSNGSYIKKFRVYIVVFGICSIVYSVMLFLAYWIDRLNLFFEFSLLRILTFNVAEVSPDENTIITKGKNKKIKIYMNEIKIIITLILGVILGVLCISGILNRIIYYLIKIYHGGV